MRQRAAGGRVPMNPNAVPVRSPMIITKGDKASLKVPMEKGTVSPSRMK